jgi:hypothetical protein
LVYAALDLGNLLQASASTAILSAASSGLRVLLIDAGLRHPSALSF